MEKVLCVTTNNGTVYGMDEVSKLLEDGWEVKSVTPVAEYVSLGGYDSSYSGIKGNTYTYFVLTKKFRIN